MSEVIQPKERSHIVQHLRRLGRLQLKLLSVAMVLGFVGFGVYVMAELNRPVATSTPGNIASPGLSVPDGGGNSSTGNAAPPPDSLTPSQTWTGWGGSKGMKLGFGFVGGFVIGFLFRAFVKITTLVGVVIIGGLAALSHFNILHIDWAAARTAYDTHEQWITDHAIHLKDVLIAHLPSSTTGAAGMYFGTRRR